MGANISGAGTDVIKIRGVEQLTGVTYSIIPDQIEAGTFMVAAAATGGDVLIKNVTPKHLESITAKLLEMGVKNVIITLGERGCAYNSGDEIIFKSVLKTNVVDTTSAGDTFVGALVSKLSQNESLHNAVDYATKAAAITVSREGASKSIPYANEIQ
jgi:sugar/nucleoside kinase (ribokinase family)